MLSAHGTAPDIEENFNDIASVSINSVCPLVTKVHHEAKNFSKEKTQIIYVGHKNHDEAKGALGVSPKKVQKVYGVFKAYCTRVGKGPFPTELFNKEGDKIAKKGNEFGSTTGRARRCGWLDLLALKYAVMLNGVTELFMMKADVLSGFDKVFLCTKYLFEGKEIDYFPSTIGDSTLEPIYESFNGWKNDISNCKEKSDFPKELINYIQFIENNLIIEKKYNFILLIFSISSLFLTI